MTPNSVAGLTVKRVPLDSVIRDPQNVRLHDEDNLAVVESSLKEWGQVEPLVVAADTKRIIGGNGRHEVMERLGWTEVDIVEIDLKDANAARALALVLNRSAEKAEWDYPELGVIMRELQAADYDLKDLGWDSNEAATLLAADWTPRDPQAGALNDETTAFPYRVTPEQREVIDKAIAYVRAENGDDLSEGRCLELIAADFISGAVEAEPAHEGPDAP